MTAFANRNKTLSTDGVTLGALPDGDIVDYCDVAGRAVGAAGSHCSGPEPSVPGWLHFFSTN